MQFNLKNQQKNPNRVQKSGNEVNPQCGCGWHHFRSIYIGWDFVYCLKVKKNKPLLALVNDFNCFQKSKTPTIENEKMSLDVI